MALAFRTHPPERTESRMSAEASDEQLIASGDSTVFAQLYDRYVDGIYTYCRLRLPSDAEAEDATAAVFEKAFAAYPPAPTGSFRGWLFTIAHNVVISVYRMRGRRGIHQPIDEVFDLVDPGLTPEETVLRADERRMLARALAELPETQRQVVELRLAGLTGAEIAETLKKSESAVRQLQFRAMQRLRELLPAPRLEERDVF